MKAEELKTKTVDELNKLLGDLKKQQFNLRFQASQGQLEHTAQLRSVRRDVARVVTFLNAQKAGNAPAATKKAAAAKKAPAKKAEKETAAKTTKSAPKTKKKSGEAA